MKTYPHHTPEGIIELVEQREYDDLFKKLCEAEELIREIRDDEVNPQDEADKFLRDQQPSELSKVRRERDAALAEITAMRGAIREAHDALNWTLMVLPPPFDWHRFQVANAALAKLQPFTTP